MVRSAACRRYAHFFHDSRQPSIANPFQIRYRAPFHTLQNQVSYKFGKRPDVIQNTDRPEKAIEYLIRYIERVNPELMVVDYMLSASYGSLTGIDLVNRIRVSKGGKFKEIPVVFLSRTSRSERIIRDSVPENEHTLWVEKGYAGLENLDEAYLQRHLKSKIPGLIGKCKFEHQIDILDEIIDSSTTMLDFNKQMKKFRETFISQKRYRPELAEDLDYLRREYSKMSGTILQHHMNLLNGQS